MDRMNYINKDKNHMTQEEWIKYLEESIRELRKEKENLKKEKGTLKAELHNTQLLLNAGMEDYMELEEENKKLKMSEKRYKNQYDFDEECLRKLEEENRKLSEENGQLKIHIEAKDKAYESLLTDYNYLEAMIKRMEKKFLEYVENHKKLEDELDDVIMNR